VSERAYVMTAVRAAKWFQPGVYYSSYVPNVDKRDAREDLQHDVSAFLRFDINAYWLFKLEAHYMHGTAGLQPGLNDNTPLDMLSRDWAVFLAKTTAYF